MFYGKMLVHFRRIYIMSYIISHHITWYPVFINNPNCNHCNSSYCMITMIPCVLVESLFEKWQMVLFEHRVPLIPIPTDYPDSHKNDHGWLVHAPCLTKPNFNLPINLYVWLVLNQPFNPWISSNRLVWTHEYTLIIINPHESSLINPALIQVEPIQPMVA